MPAGTCTMGKLAALAGLTGKVPGVPGGGEALALPTDPGSLKPCPLFSSGPSKKLKLNSLPASKLTSGVRVSGAGALPRPAVSDWSILNTSIVRPTHSLRPRARFSRHFIICYLYSYIYFFVLLSLWAFMILLFIFYRFVYSTFFFLSSRGTSTHPSPALSCFSCYILVKLEYGWIGRESRSGVQELKAFSSWHRIDAAAAEPIAFTRCWCCRRFIARSIAATR